MKLADTVDTTGHGFREIEERARLKHQADKIRAGRVGRLAAAAGCDPAHAEAVLELIASTPGEFGIAVAEEPKPRAKIKRTPGQVRSLEVNMRDLLLSFESLSRLLPESDRERLRDPIYHTTEALEVMGRPDAKS